MKKIIFLTGILSLSVLSACSGGDKVSLSQYLKNENNCVISYDKEMYNLRQYHSIKTKHNYIILRTNAQTSEYLKVKYDNEQFNELLKIFQKCAN